MPEAYVDLGMAIGPRGPQGIRGPGYHIVHADVNDPAGYFVGSKVINGASSAITVAGVSVPSGYTVSVTSIMPFAAGIPYSIKMPEGASGSKIITVNETTLDLPADVSVGDYLLNTGIEVIQVGDVSDVYPLDCVRVTSTMPFTVFFEANIKGPDYTAYDDIFLAPSIDYLSLKNNVAWGTNRAIKTVGTKAVLGATGTSGSIGIYDSKTNRVHEVGNITPRFWGGNGAMLVVGTKVILGPGMPGGGSNSIAVYDSETDSLTEVFGSSPVTVRYWGNGGSMALVGSDTVIIGVSGLSTTSLLEYDVLNNVLTEHTGITSGQWGGGGGIAVSGDYAFITSTSPSTTIYYYSKGAHTFTALSLADSLPAPVTYVGSGRSITTLSNGAVVVGNINAGAGAAKDISIVIVLWPPATDGNSSLAIKYYNLSDYYTSSGANISGGIVWGAYGMVLSYGNTAVLRAVDTRIYDTPGTSGVIYMFVNVIVTSQSNVKFVWSSMASGQITTSGLVGLAGSMVVAGDEVVAGVGGFAMNTEALMPDYTPMSGSILSMQQVNAAYAAVSVNMVASPIVRKDIVMYGNPYGTKQWGGGNSCVVVGSKAIFGVGLAGITSAATGTTAYFCIYDKSAQVPYYPYASSTTVTSVSKAYIVGGNITPRFWGNGGAVAVAGNKVVFGSGGIGAYNNAGLTQEMTAGDSIAVLDLDTEQVEEIFIGRKAEWGSRYSCAAVGRKLVLGSYAAVEGQSAVAVYGLPEINLIP